MSITKEERQSYLDLNGTACYACGSMDIKEGGTRVVRRVGTVTVNRTCDGCFREWVESYKLTDIEAPPTTAEKIAARLGNDGGNFATQGGTSLVELVRRFDAKLIFSRRNQTEGGNAVYVEGIISDHLAGDPVRYHFSDGSAIITKGSRWDIATGGLFETAKS
jgi:hypothetical protein